MFIPLMQNVIVLTDQAARHEGDLRRQDERESRDQPLLDAALNHRRSVSKRRMCRKWRNLMTDEELYCGIGRCVTARELNLLQLDAHGLEKFVVEAVPKHMSSENDSFNPGLVCKQPPQVKAFEVEHSEALACGITTERIRTLWSKLYRAQDEASLR